MDSYLSLPSNENVFMWVDEEKAQDGSKISKKKYIRSVLCHSFYLVWCLDVRLLRTEIKLFGHEIQWID